MAGARERWPSGSRRAANPAANARDGIVLLEGPPGISVNEALRIGVDVGSIGHVFNLRCRTLEGKETADPAYRSVDRLHSSWRMMANPRRS
jgi:hypothetical protein